VGVPAHYKSLERRCPSPIAGSVLVMIDPQFEYLTGAVPFIPASTRGKGGLA
jgi:hypothetical protein